MKCYVCGKRFSAHDKIEFTSKHKIYCRNHSDDSGPDTEIGLIAQKLKELG